MFSFIFIIVCMLVYKVFIYGFLLPEDKWIIIIMYYIKSFTWRSNQWKPTSYSNTLVILLEQLIFCFN